MLGEASGGGEGQNSGALPTPDGGVGPADDPQMSLNAPTTKEDWQVVELLELPDLG
ncbi:hypothetical protein NicSoilE8_16780 [Arthrobacter sp. NicSoilE8]|nr:hypothetical protein NicSoilE8_16780 [Arthrobacter sp. NicSoilE8]